jgi:hypothetical protein
VTAAILAAVLVVIGATETIAQCVPSGWIAGMGVSGTDTTTSVRAMVMWDVDGAGPAAPLLVVGGRFMFAGNVPANNIASYDPATGSWAALGTGLNSDVRALAVLPSGDLVAGGFFTLAGSLQVNRIARFQHATGTWTTMGSGADGWVLALTTLSGGDLVVGGGFQNIGSLRALYVARYRSGWTTMAGLSNQVNALTGLPNGDVVAGGLFFSATGKYVSRYGATTGAWSPLDSGMNGVVNELITLPGGDLLAGGSFTTAGGVPANAIARFNFSTGVWSSFGSGLEGTHPTVGALTILSGGDIVAGGTFTVAGGVPARSVARYEIATGAWSSLGSGTNSGVYSLATLPNGDIAVGGEFVIAGGEDAAHFARYRFGDRPPAITSEPQSASTCPGGAAAVTVVATGTEPLGFRWQITDDANADRWTDLNDGLLTVGGVEWGMVSGTRSSTCIFDNSGAMQRIVVRCLVSNNCGSVASYPVAYVICLADFNCSGGDPSVQDLFDFLAAYFSGDPRADLNGTGGISEQDVFDYLAAFFDGCV